MKTLLTGLLSLLIMSACNNSDNPSTSVNTPIAWPAGVKAPFAEKIPHDTILHGDTLHDDYYWMNGYFKKNADSSKVVAYLHAENAYTDTMMSATKDFQKKLFDEMKARIKEKDESVPVFKNGYFYYSRNEEGKEYFKYCRKKGSLAAPEEVLLDVDELAKGHGYYGTTGFNVSDDNKLLAYGVDQVSRRQYEIHIKNLETGEMLTEVIPQTTGSSVWGNDNKTLFYTYNNPKTLLTEKIYRHTLGSKPADDVVVYEEKDNTNYIGVAKSKSNEYIYIVSGGTLSSEVRYIKAAESSSRFKLFCPRMKDVLYDVDDQNGKFLIVTNMGAKNFRLMTCTPENTTPDAWEEMIPHRADVLLEGIDVFKDFLVVTERKNGLLQIRVRKLSAASEHALDFGEPAYAASVASNPEYNTNILRFQYTSLTTPNSTFDYNMDSKEKKLMKQQEVVGGYDAKNYVTERLYAKSRDGVSIPISVVYRKGFEKNGKSPLLLYAYGSYGYSMDATFSSNRLSLLDRGFVYAIAHIRGGQEMGRQWYEDGKMQKKMNSFYDFIDCGEFLVKERFTSKEHLYAQGGSAGGLLMGAVVNLKPDLWNGVIAQVPFVDVINTMLDESIPLTTNEFDEWGNPKVKEHFDYMKKYSPYDNVFKGDYPNMLVTTGLHDSQVQYFEPAKWVSKIRTLKSDKNVVLLHVNMETGHGGASGRFDYLKEIALTYAFLFALEGITK